MAPDCRLGLVGAGPWGRRFIENINRIQGVRLTRLASRNPVSQSLVDADCVVSADWRSVVTAKDLNGVIIATPTPWHATMALAAVKSGIPVLVEKPLTISVPRARVLRRAAVKRKCLVMVGHIHVYSAAYQTLKRLAKDRGAVQRIESTGGSYGPFRYDTPPLWDYGSHDLALCLDLLGEYPITIHAQCLKSEHTQNGFGEWVLVNLEFPSGAQALIEVSNLMTEKKRRFAVQFHGSQLVYDDLASDKLVNIQAEGKTEPIVIPDTSPLLLEIKHFCESIRLGIHEDQSLETGLAVVDILAECSKQLRSFI
jgi:predicted dehydrogenase